MTPPAGEVRIVLVVRRTRLDELIARFNTRDQARFYIEHLGGDFADYEAEDAAYKQARADAAARLATLGRVHILDRGFLSNYIFGPTDLIVTLGQDGLVANVLKYLRGQPVLGLNPEPGRYEGVLLPFHLGSLESGIQSVLSGRGRFQQATMIEARLNTGQSLLAVNDLFIGPKTHGSARYILSAGGREEQQSSSGIIVSTGLGSTGWLSSIVAGAVGIAEGWGGGKWEDSHRPNPRFPWDADLLYFSVREPWPSRTTGSTMTFGKISPGRPLQIRSLMPENGVIFSDGMEADFLEFNSGCEADVTIAPQKGVLVQG